MWDEQFEMIIRNSLPFLSVDEELGPDLRMMEAGLDSMGIVELLGKLEAVFGVQFRDETLVLETFETPMTLWKVVDGLR